MRYVRTTQPPRSPFSTADPQSFRYAGELLAHPFVVGVFAERLATEDEEKSGCVVVVLEPSP
jgi:hypothetical protein